MVIIYMVTAMIVGTGIVLLGSLDRIETNKRLHREQAFYLAEAGINLARYDLKNAIPLPTDPQTVNSGTWTGTFVLSETGTDTITVTSTGTVKRITETTRLIVTNFAGGPFANGIFGNVSLTVENNSVMDGYDSRLGPYSATNVDSNQGDAGSNLYISVSNNGLINGDATVSAPPPAINGVQWITGNKTYNTPLTTLPPVIIPSDLTGLPYLAGNTSWISPPGSYTLSGTPANSELTITGTATISGGDFRFSKITVSNNATLNITGNFRFYITNGGLMLSNNSQTNLGATVLGEIYADTSIVTLENNSSLNYPGDPTHLGIYITSTQTQHIENNAFISAVIYAPRAPVIVKNNGGFFGTIAAYSVLLDQNAKTHYDIALRKNHPPGFDPGGGTPVITFVSWTKPDWKK